MKIGFPISHSVLNIRQWIKNRKPVIISLDVVIVRTYEESLHLSYLGFTLSQAMKALRESRGIALLILDLCTRWG